MPPLTIATADAALKQIYVPGYMNDVCYKDRPLLAMLPKYEKFGGRNMPIVLEYGHPAGRSQVFATAQANAIPSQFEDFLLTRVHDYGVTQVDGETIDAMEGDTYAWVRGLSSQIDGILNQTARNLHIMAYRNGSGYRGVVGVGTGTAVLTLTNPEDAHLFEVGMSIDGATGAGAPHGTPDTISAINRIAGTLTSTLATWPAAILNGDNLFVEGDYTVAAGINMVSGLQAWVPAAAPGAGLFFGVNRTFDITRLGGLRLNAAALTIEEGLNNAANLVAAHGGTPDHCFMNYTNYQDLINALGAKATYEQIESAHTGMSGARIGFEGVRIIGPKGPIKVIPDNACPVDTAFMLQLDTWVCASIGGAPKILNQDGNRYLRVNNADQVEVRQYSYQGAPLAQA
jgi:hypothetical protein